MINNILLFIILFTIYFMIKKYILKPSPSDTPAGAIVMACGIFINGAMKNIKFLEKNFSLLSAILLLLLWIFIWSSYGASLIKGTFVQQHLSNPIKSFAIGTWIAGTSVTGVAVYQRFQSFSFLAYILLCIGAAIWLFYLGVIVRGYKTIFSKGLQNKLHGVILLSTVSTQSLVVLWSNIFSKVQLTLVSQLMIGLGTAFYLFGFILVIKRYFFTKGWTFEEDWQNTNCIWHGAMSITGLASASSGAINNNIILVIWLWVLIWFVIVECIEIIRAFKRIKKYGFVKGIAIYDVSQWSRIFTFGMLYAFTMKFNLKAASYANDFMFGVQNFILKYGTYVMVFILIVEGVLFFKYESRKSSNH